MKGLTFEQKRARNRRDKKALVETGGSHGILVYEGDNAIGWCAYGLKQEFPRIDNGRNYKRLSLEESQRVWRIACFFVDNDHRRKGVAKVALRAALNSIKSKGGGLVEAYPVTNKAVKTWSDSSKWSPYWFGSESMFKREEFKVVAPMGPYNLLMRRTVRL